MTDFLTTYQAAAADITAIIGGYHGTPHTILGPHQVVYEGSTPPQLGVIIRAFRPLDQQVFVHLRDSGQRLPMVRTHAAGFFELFLADVTLQPTYELLLIDSTGQEHAIEDPLSLWLLSD